MNIGEIGIVALVVVTVVDVVKELYPKLSGNGTRLVALLVGGGLGYLGQLGVIPVDGLTLITGAVAGVAAVGGHTLVTKAGSKK